MATQDNQVTQTTGSEPETGTVQISDTIRNVTGYIHFNKDEDLTKIFETLRTFRTTHRLKYYHHRQGFVFFSVKSDCLAELAKVQPFKVSHYSSKSTYSCTKDVADKLVAVRDSFVRLSWDESSGTVQFLSRTIGRVHNELVRRVFKASGETFERELYHFVPHVSSEEKSTDGAEDTEPILHPIHTTGRGGPRGVRGSRGNTRGSRGGTGRGSTHVTVQHESTEGFTRVSRDKSKYNKNRVQSAVSRGGGRGGHRVPSSA